MTFANVFFLLFLPRSMFGYNFPSYTLLSLLFFLFLLFFSPFMHFSFFANQYLHRFSVLHEETFIFFLSVFSLHFPSRSMFAFHLTSHTSAPLRFLFTLLIHLHPLSFWIIQYFRKFSVLHEWFVICLHKRHLFYSFFNFPIPLHVFFFFLFLNNLIFF